MSRGKQLDTSFALEAQADNFKGQRKASLKQLV
jgi:hypothetical protein